MCDSDFVKGFIVKKLVQCVFLFSLPFSLPPGASAHPELVYRSQQTSLPEDANYDKQFSKKVMLAIGCVPDYEQRINLWVFSLDAEARARAALRCFFGRRQNKDLIGEVRTPQLVGFLQ